MDSFATIAIASMGGFVPSIIVAILTNGTLFLLGRLKLIFILCQMMTALGSSFIFSLAKKNGEEKISLDSFMMAGFLSAFTNGIFGSLFAAFYHYNLTAIEQGILFVTNNVIAANLIGGFLLNLLDKAFAAFIAYGMYLLILKKCERAWSSCEASHWIEERTKESDEGSVQYRTSLPLILLASLRWTASRVLQSLARNSGKLSSPQLHKSPKIIRIFL